MDPLNICITEFMGSYRDMMMEDLKYMGRHMEVNLVFVVYNLMSLLMVASELRGIMRLTDLLLVYWILVLRGHQQQCC